MQGLVTDPKKKNDMQIQNAIIDSVTLTNGDHGVLSVWIYLDYGGSVQGFGGHALYLPKSFKHHKGQANFAGHFIYRVLEIAGVEKWEELRGKTVRVRKGDGFNDSVDAIGHIVKDDWFDPAEDFKILKAELV